MISSSSHHQEASSSPIAHATKLTTTSKNNQNDINCVTKVNDTTTRNDGLISSTLAAINSHVDHSVPVSTQIKKKSSSFLHRDYNRKPILARSQVSIAMRLSNCNQEGSQRKKLKKPIRKADKQLLFSQGLLPRDFSRLSFRVCCVMSNINFDIGKSTELQLIHAQILATRIQWCARRWCRAALHSQMFTQKPLRESWKVFEERSEIFFHSSALVFLTAARFTTTQSEPPFLRDYLFLLFMKRLLLIKRQLH